MSYLNTFKRKELKFALSEEKFRSLWERLEGMVLADKYAKETVSNIYFDNDYDELIRTSMSKPVYKEKLRLRCYGVPDDSTTAFAEIKKKYKGIVYKRRECMSYAEAYNWLVNGAAPLQQTQVTGEIDYIIKKYGLYPKIAIFYDRTAYYAKDDEEFRITFDSNIRSRTTQLDLRMGTFGELLEDQPYCVMEIKAVGAVPVWLTDILSERQIYLGSFSKYGSIYNQSIRSKTDGAAQKNKDSEDNSKCFQVS